MANVEISLVHRGHKNRIEIGILLSIIILGCFLRFYQLGEHSLNSDGIQIVRRALGTATGYGFGNALIYSKLLRSVLLILPQNDFVVRLLSAVFGVLAIPVIYVVGARLLNRSTAMIAAILLAASGLHLHYSRHVHSYTLLMLLSLWSIYLMWKALETNLIRDWLILGVCNGLAILAHQFAVFYIASEIVIIIVILLFRRPAGALEGSCVWRAVTVRLASSIALTVVIALPVVAQIGAPLTKVFSSVGSTGAAFRGGHLDPSLWMGFLTNIVCDFSSFPSSSPVRVITIFGIFLIGLGNLMITRRVLGISAALWLILPLLPAIVFTQLSGLTFFSRRVIFLLPVWLLVVAYGFSSVSEWIISRFAGSGRARLVTCTICVVAVGAIGWSLAGVPAQRYLVRLKTTSQHWREIALFLEQATLPEDKIVIWPERSIRYYFPHPERTVEAKFWDSQNAGREIDSGQKYWFVIGRAYQKFFPDRALRIEEWISNQDLVSFYFDAYVRIAYSSDHPAGSLARIKEKVSVLQGAINAYPAGKRLRRYHREAVTRRQILQKITGKFLDGVEREGEGDGDVRLLLADALSEDFPGEALSYYELRIDSSPNDSSAHVGRGKVLLALKRYHEGISSLRIACGLSNGLAAPWTEPDGSISGQGRIEEVIAVVEDAAARDGSGPDWFFLRLELARLLHETSAGCGASMRVNSGKREFPISVGIEMAIEREYSDQRWRLPLPYLKAL